MIDEELARYFLALGHVGDVERAAELAGVELERAQAWVDELPRPKWLTRRREAAARLFDTACAALKQASRILADDAAPADGAETRFGLRELVTTAERFLGVALKLDREVGADVDPELAMDLGGWAAAADGGVGRASAASGPTGSARK